MINISSRSQLNELLEYYNLPKIVVEVGVAEGRYSQEMLAWNLEKLYLVDIWEEVPFITGCASFPKKWHDDNYESVKKVQEQSNGVIEILKGFSHDKSKEVPDESCGLIYIDGDHTYEGCKTDIKYWLPKLVQGGVMAFHDYANPTYGVGRAVNEYCSVNEIEVIRILENNHIENIGAYFIKK